MRPGSPSRIRHRRPLHRRTVRRRRHSVLRHRCATQDHDAQDTKFFTDVAEADSALASYERKQENVALRALLTDGSAFCALLTRGGGLDEALVEEATGARGTESQTHLPLSVTTFNTIESVALLTLCPTEQRLLPASIRAKIRTLGKSLGKRPG